MRKELFALASLVVIGPFVGCPGPDAGSGVTLTTGQKATYYCQKARNCLELSNSSRAGLSGCLTCFQGIAAELGMTIEHEKFTYWCGHGTTAVPSITYDGKNYVCNKNATFVCNVSDDQALLSSTTPSYIGNDIDPAATSCTEISEPETPTDPELVATTEDYVEVTSESSLLY